ncbi:hypothetical protein [Streptomyces sp. NPDC046984]
MSWTAYGQVRDEDQVWGLVVAFPEAVAGVEAPQGRRSSGRVSTT